MTMIAMSRQLLERKVVCAVSCSQLEIVKFSVWNVPDSNIMVIYALKSQLGDHVCCVSATTMMVIYCV